MGPWTRRSEFRGRYLGPSPDILPFSRWLLAILAVLGIIAITLAIISWNARADGYGEPIVMEVWAIGYSASEGFTNCRLLIASGVDPAIAHNLHTCTSNGFEPDWGVCAVDPAYIEYGSIIYSKKYADLCGHYALAVDSGGLINGFDVDYWVETENQAQSLTGYEEVKLLRRGWNEWLCNPADWGLTP